MESNLDFGMVVLQPISVMHHSGLGYPGPYQTVNHPYTPFVRVLTGEDAGRGHERGIYYPYHLPCLCISIHRLRTLRNSDQPDQVVTTIADHSLAAGTDRSLLKWEYDFGDGTPVYTLQTYRACPYHATCGEYVITLNVFDSMNC